MKVIPPIDLGEAQLISSTVAEPSAGETLWSAATNYSVNTEVIRTTTHRKYTCLVAGVDAGLPENTPTRWKDAGPTNRYAMFDKNRSIATDSGSGTMTVVVSPGKRFDSIAVLGVEATSVTVTVRKSGSIVYGPVVTNMSGRTTSSWYEYFFGEFSYIPSLVLTEVPPISGSEITLEFVNTSGNCKCSTVVVGMSIYMGLLQYGAKSDALNFSKIERDDFGNSLLVPRRTVPRTDQVVFADKSLTNTLRKVRTDLNAIPALWYGVDDVTSEYFEALVVFGIYKKFEIDISEPSRTTINLELEEL